MNGLVTHREDAQGVKWVTAIRRNTREDANAPSMPSRARTARDRGSAPDLRLSVTLPAVCASETPPGAPPTAVLACPRAAALPRAYAIDAVNHYWGWTVR
jgi:hypothetical protein